MKLERVKKPVTRSVIPPENLTPLFSVGKLYSIRADARDFSDGFCIARAVEFRPNSFTANYLEKAVDQNDESKVLIVETQTMGQFKDKTVLAVIVSAISIDVNVVAIDKVEFEEILYSANIES